MDFVDCLICGARCHGHGIEDAMDQWRTHAERYHQKQVKPLTLEKRFAAPSMSLYYVNYYEELISEEGVLILGAFVWTQTEENGLRRSYMNGNTRYVFEHVNGIIKDELHFVFHLQANGILFNLRVLSWTRHDCPEEYPMTHCSFEGELVWEKNWSILPPNPKPTKVFQGL